MGPTVWELEGPMPILKSSKRLVFTEVIVGGRSWLWLEVRTWWILVVAPGCSRAWWRKGLCVILSPYSSPSAPSDFSTL